jgi:hypothetical protein
VSAGTQKKEYKPRFARTPEDLIFYTDTKEEDYPVYLLDSYEVVLKKASERVTEAERFAIFHVKSVDIVECYNHEDSCYAGYSPLSVDCDVELSLSDYVDKYSQLPLKQIIDTASSMNLKMHIRTLRILYEVYRGDYEELLGEVSGYAVVVVIEPPYSLLYDEDDKKWAITHSTLKRFLAKLPAETRPLVEKYAYLDKIYTGRKGLLVSHIRIKLPVPTPELERVFSEVKKYLRESRRPWRLKKLRERLRRRRSSSRRSGLWSWRSSLLPRP